MPGPHDELKNLADTFDTLLDRLQAAFDAERRFTANASHGLRTPLAIQDTLLEVGLSDSHASVEELRVMGEGIQQVNRRGKRLIEGLLALARIERGIDNPQQVNLATAPGRKYPPDTAQDRLRIESHLVFAIVNGDRRCWNGWPAT